MYQHKSSDGQVIDLPVTRAVCIGRNYLDHIAELNNTVPDEALFFMKPAPALCDMSQPVIIPSDLGECHNELELAVLLNKPLKNASEDDVLKAIEGFGLALDLTLRDVQSKLKSEGYPWERAKAFDGSCPLSGFVPAATFSDLSDIHFTLTINGEMKQQGHTAKMIRPLLALIAEMSSVFTLMPGDVILTGTPKGVGPLVAGDSIEASLQDGFTVTTRVEA